MSSYRYSTRLVCRHSCANSHGLSAPRTYRKRHGCTGATACRPRWIHKAQRNIHTCADNVSSLRIHADYLGCSGHPYFHYPAGFATGHELPPPCLPIRCSMDNRYSPNHLCYHWGFSLKKNYPTNYELCAAARHTHAAPKTVSPRNVLLTIWVKKRKGITSCICIQIYCPHRITACPHS